MTTSGEAFATIFCMSGTLAIITMALGSAIISKLYNRKANLK